MDSSSGAGEGGNRRGAPSSQRQVLSDQQKLRKRHGFGDSTRRLLPTTPEQQAAQARVAKLREEAAARAVEAQARARAMQAKADRKSLRLSSRSRGKVNSSSSSSLKSPPSRGRSLTRPATADSAATQSMVRKKRARTASPDKRRHGYGDSIRRLVPLSPQQRAEFEQRKRQEDLAREQQIARNKELAAAAVAASRQSAAYDDAQRQRSSSASSATTWHTGTDAEEIASVSSARQRLASDLSDKASLPEPTSVETPSVSRAMPRADSAEQGSAAPMGLGHTTSANVDNTGGCESTSGVGDASVDASTGRETAVYGVRSVSSVQDTVAELARQLAQRQTQRRHFDDQANTDSSGSAHGSDGVVAFDGTSDGRLFSRLAHAQRALWMLSGCRRRPLLQASCDNFRHAHNVLLRRVQVAEAELSLLRQARLSAEQETARIASSTSHRAAALARKGVSAISRRLKWLSRRGGASSSGNTVPALDDDAKLQHGEDRAGNHADTDGAVVSAMRKEAAMHRQVQTLRARMAEVCTYQALALLGMSDMRQAMEIMVAHVACDGGVAASAGGRGSRQVAKTAGAGPSSQLNHGDDGAAATASHADGDARLRQARPARQRDRADAHGAGVARLATTLMACLCARFGYTACAAELLEYVRHACDCVPACLCACP